MKYVAVGDAQKFENGQTCTVFEYGGDADLSGAIAEINGRYPESGWSFNTAVKEMVFVLSGEGKIVTDAGEKTLIKDTMVLLDINERYYFEGTMLRIFMPTTPAWTPEQYRIVQ
jgi:mannose-6-phosphate isomerase-like protein (cupin superfamily)